MYVGYNKTMEYLSFILQQVCFIYRRLHKQNVQSFSQRFGKFKKVIGSNQFKIALKMFFFKRFICVYSPESILYIKDGQFGSPVTLLFSFLAPKRAASESNTSQSHQFFLCENQKQNLWKSHLLFSYPAGKNTKK